MKNIGLYIHVPFCKTVCPYCDFYKVRCTGNEQKRAEYIESVKRELLKQKKGLASREVDTIYFGGGTPSSLSSKDFREIFSAIHSSFNVSKDAEITVEMNPSSEIESLAKTLSELGVNRVSFGMQSSVDTERKMLGRLSDSDRVLECLEIIRDAGILNISIDLMLGVPGQTRESLLSSLEFIKQTEVPHVSAYMLKLEEGTNFYNRFSSGKLILPTEDETVELYNMTCDYLEGIGLHQYEISNFAKPSYESHHNLKYWHCEEYLGIGPSAHSFVNGKRMFYEADLDEFISSPTLVEDGEGGSPSERLMLALRLSEGYTGPLLDDALKKAKSLSNYLTVKEVGEGIYNLRLNRNGFLISNYIISELI